MSPMMMMMMMLMAFPTSFPKPKRAGKAMRASSSRLQSDASARLLILDWGFGDQATWGATHGIGA